MGARPRIDWDAPESPLYDLIGRLAVGVVRAYVDLTVVGAERVPRTGPVVLAANHPSYLDSVVLGATFYRLGRRPRFLALSTMWDQPVAGWVFRRTRMIPVYRGAGPDVMVRDACAALEAGQALIVYPEGQLAPPGVDAPPRPGAGLLALRSAAPVVPLASVGLEPSRGRPPLRRRAALVVGEQVDLSAWAGRDDRDAQIAASGAILDAVRDLLPAAREAVGAKSGK